MAVPPQCPDCGRFLKRAFAQTLLAESAPCPKCAEALSAIEVDGELEVVLAAPGGAETTATPTAATPAPITRTINGHGAASTTVVGEVPTLDAGVVIVEDDGTTSADVGELVETSAEDQAAEAAAASVATTTTTAVDASEADPGAQDTGDHTADDTDEVIADETAETDVLAGWDERAPDDEVGLLDTDDTAPDTATVVGLGVGAGAVAGLLLGGRRPRGAVIGALLGAAAAFGFGALRDR